MRISAIKQRDQDEKDLEKLFASALDALPSHIAILDAGGTILAVNAAWRRFAEANNLNLPASGIGSNYLQLCRSAVGDDSHLAQAAAQGLSDVIARRRDRFDFEYPCHCPYGQCWFALRVTPLDNRKPGYVVVAHDDITDRKGAEAKLQTMQQRLQGLVYAAPVILHAGRASGDYGVTFVSESVRTQLGYDPSHFCETPHFWSRHIHPQDRPRVLAKALRVLQRGHARFEYRFLDAQSHYRWIYHELNLTRCAEGRFLEIVGAAIDISAFKHQEEKLRMSRRHIRELAMHLESLREQERARIARELHDVVGQEFTALKIDLARLRSHLQTECVAEVNALIEHVDSVIGIVQNISTDLRPAVLDDLGLRAAIDWQARHFQTRTGVVCRVSFPPQPVEPDKERAIALFRILQEALTNVARHAEATEVEVRLASEDRSVWLIVEDNGKGISELKIKEGQGLGLLGIRERAYLLHGEVAVSNRPEGGTRIAARIPL